jgi:transporter family protein
MTWIFWALLSAWLIALAGNSTGALTGLTRRTWVFLGLSGLATGLSWMCYFRALQLGPASRVAPVDKLSVVFTILFAVVLLHEKLGWQQWLGGSFVVVGAVILAVK